MIFQAVYIPQKTYVFFTEIATLFELALKRTEKAMKVLLYSGFLKPHFTEVYGLCFHKFPCKRLRNFLYFFTKPHVVYFSFSITCNSILPLMNTLVHIDIVKGMKKNKELHKVKNEKTIMPLFIIQTYEIFCIVSLSYFIKHKHFISEEYF